MKNIFCLFTCFFLTLFIYAQNTGEIKGTVIDNVTQNPLIGANVFIKINGSPIGTATDLDGYFTLKPIPTGTHTLHFSFLSYSDFSFFGVVVKPNDITFLDKIMMKPDAQLIDSVGVIIEATQTIFQPKLLDLQGPSIITIQPEEIEQLPDPRDLQNTISLLSPGVNKTPQGLLTFRGSRPGMEAYYVDGVRVSDINTGLPGGSVGSMTVYSGGVPARYGDFTGGVVIIETKSYFDLLNRWKAEQEKIEYEKMMKDHLAKHGN